MSYHKYWVQQLTVLMSVITLRSPIFAQSLSDFSREFNLRDLYSQKAEKTKSLRREGREGLGTLFKWAIESA